MNKEKLNIAFVVDRYGSRWGGAESYGVELMRILSTKHNITVFARDYDEQCDLKLKYISFKTKSYWPSWYRVMRHAFQAKRLTQNGFDIVHSHNNGFAGNVEVAHVVPVRYNWRVKKRAWYKHLGSFFSIRVLSYLWLESKRMQSKPKHSVVAVSSLIAKQLHESYPHLKDIKTITPGVSSIDKTLVDQKKQSNQDLKAQLGFTKDDFVAILVARNPLRKGLITAMQAYKNLESNFKLLVVGAGPAIIKEIEEHHLYQEMKNRVILVPNTADVYPYYFVSDICLHPTLNDSFGMAPLEAMSCGLPVIISPMPWCGFAEYLLNKKDALVLDNPEDYKGLATYVMALYSNHDLRNQLIEAGYLIADNMSWKNIANAYEEIYYDLLNPTS